MAVTNKVHPAETARRFYDAAKGGGWDIDCKGEGVVSITRHFSPGDNAAFVACDGEYYGVLSLLRARGGSMWGTDGGSVGGYVALNSGRFTMNVSGVSKRVIAELCKLF